MRVRSGNLFRPACLPLQRVPARELLIDSQGRNRQVSGWPGVYAPHHDGIAAVVERQEVGIQNEEAHSASGSSSSFRRYSSIASRQG